MNITATPAAEETLRLLRQFRGVLCLDNPCRTRLSRCIYLNSDTRALLEAENDEQAIAILESEYAAEVQTLPSFVSPEVYAEIERDCVWLPSDGYICYGSVSQGSGRSVFKGKHQLKGVGRTLHVGHHGFFHDLNGALSVREAMREVVVAERLKHVLSTPPMSIDFVLIPEQGTQAHRVDATAEAPPDIRCVLGRRGSPLRIGHLDFLSVHLRATNELNVGSYLVHLLLSHADGVPATGIEAKLLEFFDDIMHRAVRLSAESRVYSMHFSYWPDNFDLFGRVIDVAETSFFFPLLLPEQASAAPPGSTDTPHRYLTRLPYRRENSRTQTLYPIRNALSALHTVAREVRMPASRIDALYSWDWLRARHAEYVCAAIAKVLGIDEETLAASGTLRNALTPVVAQFPFMTDPATVELAGASDAADGAVDSSERPGFSWETLIAELHTSEPLGPEVRAAVDHARGAAFRNYLLSVGTTSALDAITERLERNVIAPYLAKGLQAVPREWIGHSVDEDA